MVSGLFSCLESGLTALDFLFQGFRFPIVSKREKV
jgi:hypothetical protein